MTDGASSSSWMVVNGKVIFGIAPVGNPQAFADQIDFGMVTSIEGRVIQLKVDEEPFN